MVRLAGTKIQSEARPSLHQLRSRKQLHLCGLLTPGAGFVNAADINPRRRRAAQPKEKSECLIFKLQMTTGPCLPWNPRQ